MNITLIRDRLPSAAAAIAVQAGLAALLVFSFTVVRHLAVEKETILTLQPRPPAQRAPLVIDGRGSTPPRAGAAAPTLPGFAQPGFQLGAPQTGGGALRDRTGDISGAITRCRIDNYASLAAAERAGCPPLQFARPDPNALPSEKVVRNAPVWQGEVARKNAPFALPGASGGVLGILGALFSGAFNDRRNYSYAPPQSPPLQDGAEMTRQYALLNDHCLPLDDTTKRNCEYMVGATPMVAVGGMVYPSHPHVSDVAFAQALAAVQARKQSLYGQPVLASGANNGGGDEKNGLAGGAGAGGGTGSGPGR